jgi:hypothetical protein
MASQNLGADKNFCQKRGQWGKTWLEQGFNQRIF